MKHIGDVTVGSRYRRETRDVWLSNRPRSLLYEMTESKPITFVGTYPKRDEDKCLPPSPKFQDYSMTDACPFDHAYHSSAPLRGVVGLEIYHFGESRLCRGIILRYENGSERALGQCRLGVDPVRIVENPAFLCFANTFYNRPNTEVRCSAAWVESFQTEEHEHDGPGWTCCTMKDRVEFWFTYEQAKLNLAQLD